MKNKYFIHHIVLDKGDFRSHDFGQSAEKIIELANKTRKDYIPECYIMAAIIIKLGCGKKGDADILRDALINDYGYTTKEISNSIQSLLENPRLVNFITGLIGLQYSIVDSHTLEEWTNPLWTSHEQAKDWLTLNHAPHRIYYYYKTNKIDHTKEYECPAIFDK